MDEGLEKKFKINKKKERDIIKEEIKKIDIELEYFEKFAQYFWNRKNEKGDIEDIQKQFQFWKINYYDERWKYWVRKNNNLFHAEEKLFKQLGRETDELVGQIQKDMNYYGISDKIHQYNKKIRQVQEIWDKDWGQININVELETPKWYNYNDNVYDDKEYGEEDEED